MNSLISYAEMDEKLDKCHENGVLPVAFFPVGCTEQHGPYLPLQTDTIIAQGISDAICNTLPKSYCGFVFPALSYTPSKSNIDFSGTISISENSFRNVLYDIVHSMMYSKFRFVVFLTGHGPAHPSVVEVCFNAMHNQFSSLEKMKVVFVTYSLSQIRFLLEEIVQQPSGKHADWCEFLFLYYILGNSYFTESRMNSIRHFQQSNNFSIQAPSVLGCPLSMKSVHGVIGEPLPLKVSDDEMAALASKAWSATVEHICNQFVADTTDL